MFRELTHFQIQLIQEYERLAGKGNVYFHGIDQNSLPVISFEDVNGRREPFAVLHRPRKTMQLRRYNEVVGYGVAAGEFLPVTRTTTEPAYPVRDLTPLETDTMDLRSYEVLARLKYAGGRT